MADLAHRFCQSLAMSRCRNFSYSERSKQPTDPANGIIQIASIGIAGKKPSCLASDHKASRTNL
jgi:hypothetical protein